MLNIAIYDKLNNINAINYDMILNWCKKHNYKLTIYNLNCNNFIRDAHGYHIIFLNTIDKTLTNIYGIHYKIIYINQINNIDDYIEKKRPLLFKPAENDNILISKDIHFMWLSKNNQPMPKKYNKNIETFKKYNANYNIKIWHYDEINTLIKNNLPEFHDTFIKMTPWISKCDFARFCLIYILGGIYSDCDFYCNKSLDGLINNKTELYCYQPDTTELFNGFFASMPKSKFIYGWLERMEKSHGDVLFKTGPVGFGIYYQQIDIKPVLSESYYVLPYKYPSNVIKHVDKIDENYVYTLWHEGCGWNKNNNLMTIILCFLILFLILYISQLI